MQFWKGQCMLFFIFFVSEWSEGDYATPNNCLLFKKFPAKGNTWDRCFSPEVRSWSVRDFIEFFFMKIQNTRYSKNYLRIYRYCISSKYDIIISTRILAEKYIEFYFNKMKLVLEFQTVYFDKSCFRVWNT